MPNHWTAETVLLRHDRLGIFTSIPGSSDSHTNERSDVRCLLYQNGHQTELSSSVDCCNWPSRSTRLQSSPSPGKNMRPLSQKCKKHLNNCSFWDVFLLMLLYVSLVISELSGPQTTHSSASLEQRETSPTLLEGVRIANLVFRTSSADDYCIWFGTICI